MSSKKKTIFLAITHGWHARLLLQTKFLAEFAELEDLEIIIFAPNGHENDFKEKYGHLAKIESTKPQGGKAWNRFNRIRRHLITGKMSDTKRIQLEKYKSKSPFYYRIIEIFNFLFIHFPKTKRIYEVLEKFFFKDRYFKKYFSLYDPAAVIIVSTVHNEAFYMLQRSQIEKVKVIQIVESWDNPSSKLNQVKHPDYFLVWNEVMGNELNEYLGIEHKRIHITGSAFHDIYFDNSIFRSKKEIAEKYGMDPDKKWIVIAATLTNLFPEFDLFIDGLNLIKENSEFSNDIQILIRPHPQAISGYSLGHGVKELNTIREKYNYIFYDLPPLIKSSLPVYLDKKDIKNFAEILYYSDLVISFFSTATIDAAASGTPVILPAFNHGMEDFIYPTLRERVKFTHHHKLIETGGAEIANDMNDLEGLIKQYLDGIDNTSSDRDKLISLECGVIDGLSYRRMVQAIANIIFEDNKNNNLDNGPSKYY